jgi:ribose transport system ATP-binding protein
VQTGPAVIVAQGLTKTFGGRTVLNDFGLELMPGEVHALLGQNGSGKSTLIKILTGFHAPDAGGTLTVRGEDVALPLHPGQPQDLGLAFVHQDLGLAPDLSILENLRVGRYETRSGWRIPWGRERRYVRERLARFGVNADPDAPVSSLSEADRAILAIVRATEQLAHVDRGLLVLDEPTVYLTRDAVQQLFGTVRQATDDGHAVLIVTHRLEEVFELADRVTVVRDGRHVVTTPTSEVDEAGLVRHILGRSMDRLYPDTADHRGDVVLRARGMSGARLEGIDLDLREGEVLGVTGLIGMGFEEVPYLLVGAAPGTGELEIGGERLSVESVTPGAALRHGVALLPADRPQLGGVAAATVLENLTLPTLSSHTRAGRLRHRQERRHGADLLERFDVRPREPSAGFGTLSGGNQQKVLLAKWFETGPDVFILHEPTQGVDIGARQQIFSEVERAAASGTALLIASVEYEDLAHLCHRVVVLRDGRVVAELSGSQLTADRIMEQCYVGEAAPEAGRG